MKKSEFVFKNIYFIGIGGISMSALAKMAHSLGIQVSGSDLTQNEETAKLESLGIAINYNHEKDNISKDIDLVVYTGAIKKDNNELRMAKKLHIKCLERSKFLGMIAGKFKNVIAISGTHGKTTTTAMIGDIFVLAGLNPTIHLGGKSLSLEDNIRLGGSKYFIVEACEYRNSFKYIKSDTAIITNIEADHLDYYKNLGQIEKCFQSFAKKSNSVITASNTPIKNKTISIGSDWVAKSIKFVDKHFTFRVYYKNKYFGLFQLNMIGEHNVTNALFAIATASHYGIHKDIIKKGISLFKGVARRYEILSNINNCDIIIDYAHHPTEIRSSIKGMSSAYKKVLYVFQPHTYSRTYTLLDDFVEAFLPVDDLIIFKTYPAREKEIIGGRAIDLFESLYNIDAKYIEVIEDMIAEIYKNANSGDYDAILVLGAGDLAEHIRKLLI